VTYSAVIDDGRDSVIDDGRNSGFNEISVARAYFRAHEISQSIRLETVCSKAKAKIRYKLLNRCILATAGVWIDAHRE
jgi:hypothetical protein